MAKVIIEFNIDNDSFLDEDMEIMPGAISDVLNHLDTFRLVAVGEVSIVDDNGLTVGTAKIEE